MKLRVRSLCLLVVWLCCAPICASSAAQRPLVVFAAASLKNALDAVIADWNARDEYAAVVTYAGSNVLALQIERGAPADLFVSADARWMDELDAAGQLRAGTRRPLLGNALVLIAPLDSPIALRLAPGVDLAGALPPGRRIAICGDAVPAGAYAHAALAHLGAWTALRERITAADNVRAALLQVSRGEAPLGVVYASDAAVDATVRVVDRFAPELHPPIVYPAALVAGSRHPGAAALLDHLSSAPAQATFARYGFITPPSADAGH